MRAHQRLVTAEEFARIPDDGQHYELVEGRIVRVSPPGIRHGVLATRIAVLLAQHVEPRKLGVVITPGGFKLAASPDTVREPDVAFVHRDRIPNTGVPEGFWPGPPDLAVEIRSPRDRPDTIRAKVRDYLALGVRLVWVVDPNAKTVTIHRPGCCPITVGTEEMIDAGDVVPGFTCEVRSIFT